MARVSKTGVVGTCAIIVGVALGTSTLTGARQTAATAAAQQPPPSSSPSPRQPASPPQPVTADQPRLRIATTAVEIDAVVTTRNGAQVTDLRPEDLELFQDGRKQRISSLRYVALPAIRPDVRPDSNAPEDVRRTVAIVIDDLNMSFGSMHYTREALLKFVDTQIQPGDRVAVIRGDYEGTRTEWFSADKQALREKIRSIRYNLMTTSALTGAGQEQITAFDSALDLQREAFTIGTLGTVNAIVRAMRDMPGRKALVLASDGFQIIRATGSLAGQADSARVLDAVRRLVDDANRSFVVLYAVDTRRLVAPTGEVAYGQASFDISSVAARHLLYGASDGPAFLAQAGGGFYMRNSNNLASLFKRVMDDQNGYYLVSYEPDDQTFEQDAKRRRPAFHTVKLRVNRPNVRVRSRAGFFGVSDSDLQQQRSSPPSPDPLPPTRSAAPQPKQ